MSLSTTAAAAAAFVDKWERNRLNENAAAKEHFVDLCRLLGQPTPNEADPNGTFYRFEKPLTKVGGKAGFADVWRRDRFAFEYKTKGKYPDLMAAYRQLLLYKEDLDNPPILAACDISNFEIHIAFTGYKTRVERFTNSDIRTVSTRELLDLVLRDPEQLRPADRAETVTEEAAARFAQVAQMLERRGFAPERIAPFFMKLVFAFFAEDMRLLPGNLMTQHLEASIFAPQEFPDRMRALFHTMNTGGYFGLARVPRFNGGLFANDDVLPLTVDEIQFLAAAAKLDWREVEPAIFGTLFERSLDPSKRAQLGAHYTSKDDILLIVEPVLMQPLRREWAEVKTEIEALRPEWEVAEGITRQRLQNRMENPLFDFLERLGKVRVLDPAAGSGNFLYVALKQLKDLEKEVLVYSTGVGLTKPELSVSPAQLYGIEVNPFAAELAQIVVWIGYLQWLQANGLPEVKEPIIQALDNIQCRDAILEVDEQGRPSEPEWPNVDVIIGNPPFLGGNKIRKELGDQTVEALFKLYEGRVPAFADLVCYWFERARAFIEIEKVQRAGLLATNSIRGGVNRRVLEHIKETGDIFMAWDDRPWILDGANVRVSMIGFDNRSEKQHVFNDQLVININPDLTSTNDLTSAKILLENKDFCFYGSQQKGSFDITPAMAWELLGASNTFGLDNRDVVKKGINGVQILRRTDESWVIDFGIDTPLEKAALYEAPFEYIRRVVYPERQYRTEKRQRDFWWLHARPSPRYREVLKRQNRYIASPALAKHRVFVWLDSAILADHAVIVYARDDDYFIGVLQSKLHTLWALQLGTSLEDRPRYTPSTTFETFPFPWAPGHEPTDDPRVPAIAAAARDLVLVRDAWLAGEGYPELPIVKRTLTNLYNARADWLDEAHRQLDAAVCDAYGWPHDLDDEEILARLLALNVQRAAVQDGRVLSLEQSEAAVEQEQTEE
jgi:type II restriction/modification system DNA methylase subunit YeeA